MNERYKVLLPLFITFLVLTAIIFSAKLFYADQRIDYNVLTGANCLFFLVSLLVFRIQYKAMHNSNPNVFIRSVMSGLIIKMFTCIAAIVAYYFVSGALFNKPAVYISMIIYIIFLVVEVRTIMKLNKQKNA
jgi:FtsH-binding integral membrane protein